MKKILLLLLIISSTAFPFFDGNVTTAFRSFPKSGYLEAESGYNHKIWSKDNILYGYTRPSISATSAGAYNSFKADLEIAPVSFITFGSGYEIIQNRQQYADSDCSKYSCKIDLRRKYLRIKVLAGYKNFFAVINFNRSFYTPIRQVNREGFIDPQSQLSMAKNGDVINTLSTAIGAEIGDHYKILALSIFGKVSNSGDSYSHNSLLLHYQKLKLNFFGGLGVYRASGFTTRPSVLAGVKWTFKKGIGL